MHEWHLTRRLLQLVEDEAKALRLTRISRVRLRGALNAAEAEILRINFLAVARGTVAQGAALEIESCAVPGRCPACGCAAPLRDHHQRCPRCGGEPLVALGDELLRIVELTAV